MSHNINIPNHLADINRTFKIVGYGHALPWPPADSPYDFLYVAAVEFALRAEGAVAGKASPRAAGPAVRRDCLDGRSLPASLVAAQSCSPEAGNAHPGSFPP